MPSDPDSGADRSDFGLDLDELLSEAVDAVESIERKSPPRDRRRSAPGDDDLLLSGDDEAAGFELDVDLDETLTSLTDTLGEDTVPGGDTDHGDQEGGDAPGTDDLVLVELEAELAQLRQAHDEHLERAKRARAELSRLRGALRRHEEQLSREAAKLERERQMRRGAEEQISTMKRRIAQLETNLAGLRKRSQRERDEARVIGTSRSVETLLPVLDNLELAISHKDTDPARVVDGIGMIVQQFLQTLAQLGVERVVCAPGVLFDPEVHEALSQVETDDMLPGSIVEQLRPGYTFEGRLLRAARVSVARPTRGADVSDTLDEEAPPEATSAQRDDDDAPAPPVDPHHAPGGDGPDPSARELVGEDTAVYPSDPPPPGDPEGGEPSQPRTADGEPPQTS